MQNNVRLHLNIQLCIANNRYTEKTRTEQNKVKEYKMIYHVNTRSMKTDETIQVKNKVKFKRKLLLKIKMINVS